MSKIIFLVIKISKIGKTIVKKTKKLKNKQEKIHIKKELDFIKKKKLQEFKIQINLKCIIIYKIIFTQEIKKLCFIMSKDICNYNKKIHLVLFL